MAGKYNKLGRLSSTEYRFYLECAAYAMQGIQENGYKIFEVAATLVPKKTAELAFDMADAMVEELRKRLDKSEI